MSPSNPSRSDVQQKLDKLLITITDASGDLLGMLEQKSDAPFISEIRAIHEAGAKIQADLPGLFRDIEKHTETDQHISLEDAFHDLRAPLNPIVGYCALMLYESGGIEDKAVYRGVKTIEAAGYHFISALKKIEQDLLPQTDENGRQIL